MPGYTKGIRITGLNFKWLMITVCPDKDVHENTLWKYKKEKNKQILERPFGVN
jgi:hypothetical protein